MQAEDPGASVQLAALRDRLYRPDSTAEDVAAYEAAAGPRATAATRDQPAAVPAPRRRMPWMSAASVLALGSAIVAGVLLHADRAPTPSPAHHPGRVAGLRAPATDGVPLWRSHGIGSLPSSPVLEAAGTPIVVALACRGQGAILVLADNEDRRVLCRDGRVATDRELFVAPHHRFTIALSISAAVEWDLAVHEVEP